MVGRAGLAGEALEMQENKRSTLLLFKATDRPFGLTDATLDTSPPATPARLNCAPLCW